MVNSDQMIKVPKQRQVSIFALTESGNHLANRLVKLFADSRVIFRPKPFAQQLQQAFQQGDAILVIGATGIVMRILAPVLVSKYDDPPVLVLDESGQFVIPLLSGHEGGANELAQKLADCIAGQAVITTANPYLKPVYSIGMGCERHCPESVLRELLEQALAQAGLELSQIINIASIDIKADEVGLIDLAKSLQKPYLTFDKLALRSVESQLSCRSDYVFQTVGVYGVAESAALVAAGQAAGLTATQAQAQSAELVLNKIKNAQATCSIARAYPVAI